jgi:hypothetical protein
LTSLVDDQELVAGHLLLQAQEPAFVAGLHQFMDQCCCGGEADGEPFLAGGQPEPQGCMGLSGAAGAEGDDVLAPLDPFAARQLEHLHLVQAGDRLEVEAVEALGRREPGRLDPTLDHPALAIDELELHQASEKADMVQAFGRALAGELLVFPQECGQLQRLEVMGEQDLGGVGHAASPETRHM